MGAASSQRPAPYRATLNVQAHPKEAMAVDETTVCRDRNRVPIRKGHTPDPKDLDMYIIRNRAVRTATGKWEDVVALEQVCLFQDEEDGRPGGEPQHALPLLRIEGTNDKGEQADLQAIADHLGMAVYSEETHRGMGFHAPRDERGANDPFVLGLAEPTLREP